MTDSIVLSQSALVPIVLSQSELTAFKRCRRSYYYQYERNLQTKSPGDAVDNGSAFHKYMEQAAQGKKLPDDGTPMGAVAKAYLQYHDGTVVGRDCEIIGVEYSIYTKLFTAGNVDVYLRTTFDLICYDRSDGFTVLRDYKTFDRAPSYDVDLDFQGRIYIAAAMKSFQTTKVRFEYENVRRTPPFVPKDKAGNVWQPSECYLTVPLVIGAREADELLNETCDVARDLLRARGEGRFYRQDLKVGPHSCGSCFVRDACKTELQQGVLDEQTIELLYEPRDDGKRLSVQALLNDPRVLYLRSLYPHDFPSSPLSAAVQAVYGDAGRDRVKNRTNNGCEVIEK